MNRSDMCQTGQYQERGIWGMDGYDTAFALDKEQYIVRVPPELERIGVLTEPTSVVEKAIEEAARIQSVRLPDVATPGQWLTGRRCLVAGLGPIGLLGAMALRLRGADVYGIDIVDEGSSRPQWLSAIGGHYIDGRQVRIDQRDGAMGRFDLILEAAGIASLDFSLLDALATNGAYVLTGIPGESRPLQISGAELMRRLVLNNQVVIGSVNAARDHFQLAVNDLTEAHHRWGSLTERLITHRHPFTDFAAALGHHPAEEIKSTLEWTTTEHP
jgi:threonine dehydrogenase-like Zn-dependent dehydrogenase